MASEFCVPIFSEYDIVAARQKAREMCNQQGFSSPDQTMVATAVSELARNIVQYAKCGEIVLGIIQQSGRQGITVIAQDKGPGIPNIALAMQDGVLNREGIRTRFTRLQAADGRV